MRLKKLVNCAAQNIQAKINRHVCEHDQSFLAKTLKTDASFHSLTLSLFVELFSFCFISSSLAVNFNLSVTSR